MRISLFSIVFVLLIAKFSAVKAFEVDGIAYQIISAVEPRTVEVIAKNEKYQGDLVIPEVVVYNHANYKVIGIAEKAFSHCESLKSIKLPDSIIKIGMSAFSSCNIIEDFRLPNGLKEIGPHAFAACYSLTNIIIPDNVVAIGTRAFSHCDNLQNIHLSNSLDSIGKAAFLLCCNLSTIEIAKTNQKFCTIDGVLFSKDTTNLIAFPGGKMPKDSLYVVPSKVVTIMPYAFFYSRMLRNIVLSDSLEIIGDYAFNGCLNIEGVFFPRNVSKIGIGTFLNTRYLKKFEVDELNPYYCSYYGVVLNKEKTILVLQPDGMFGYPAIPRTVISTAPGAKTSRNDGFPLSNNCK